MTVTGRCCRVHKVKFTLPGLFGGPVRVRCFARHQATPAQIELRMNSRSDDGGDENGATERPIARQRSSQIGSTGAPLMSRPR